MQIKTGITCITLKEMAYFKNSFLSELNKKGIIIKTFPWPDMVAHAFNLRIRKAEAGKSRELEELHSEFQNSQNNTRETLSQKQIYTWSILTK